MYIFASGEEVCFPHSGLLGEHADEATLSETLQVEFYIPPEFSWTCTHKGHLILRQNRLTY